jgi:predicted RNA binding protein YcfA (HicA-like mRNA interferase family)
MTTRKEAKQLAEKAIAQGWAVDYTKGGHLRYKAPNGQIMFFSSTPSEPRALKNQTSLMVKNGFVK